ncbi:MAG: cytochrome c [Rhodocyclaceae bacterium]
MKIRNVVVAALAALTASAAFAQAKPEDQIRLRQGGLQLLAKNVGALAAVAKGDVPFNKEAVNARGEYINFLAQDITGSGFGAGSDKSLPTRANPKIWSDGEGFKAAAGKLTAATAKLATVADLNALKAAVTELQGACKNCHDNYRDSSYH